MPERPNVLFVITGQQRADYSSAMMLADDSSRGAPSTESLPR